MSEPIDPWDAVAAECPRKIMKLLHQAGHYHHGTCLSFPGKVLCVHRESSLFEGWEPTAAQVAAEKEVPSE